MKDESRKLAGVIVRLILIMVLAAFALIYIKNFKLENTDIRTGSYYTEDEIKEMLFTAKTDGYTQLFYLRFKLQGAPEIPFVEQIDVEMTDRNSVIVYVYDKAVTGCIEHMGSYLYFDREGIIVDSSDKRLKKIPLIKGLELTDYTMYSKLDPGSSSVFDTILDILLLLEKNGLTAEDVTFGLRNEVTLHIDDDEILLGKSDSYDLKINNIGPALAALGEGSYRLDFRNYSEDNREVDARRLE